MKIHSQLSDAEADSADDEVGGGIVVGEFDEFDRVVDGAGAQDEVAGFEGDVAEDELAAEADGVDVGLRRARRGERVVVAIEDGEAVGAQEGIHGERLSGRDADTDEAVPAAAADGAADGQGGQPVFGKLHGFA